MQRVIKLAGYVFLLLLFMPLGLSAEVIWVADRGAKQLVRVDEGGEKAIIELKDFLNPAVVEVDQRDGSVWVNDMTEPFNHQLVKLSNEGEELFRLKGFIVLGDAAIDQKDGSYYAAERMTGEVVKISSDGKELSRIKNLSPVKDLESMGCLKKTDGCHQAYEGMGINLESIDDIDVSPIDQSVWVADTGGKRLLKFTKDGEKICEKTELGEPEHLAVSADGSSWVNNIEGGKIFKVSSDNRKILARITGLDMPFELSISPVDNTCWATTRNELIQISSDGKKIIKRISGFISLQGISTINPIDGSFWVAEYLGRRIIKFSASGETFKKVEDFNHPRFLDVYWEEGK